MNALLTALVIVLLLGSTTGCSRDPSHDEPGLEPDIVGASEVAPFLERARDESRLALANLERTLSGLEDAPETDAIRHEIERIRERHQQTGGDLYRIEVLLDALRRASDPAEREELSKEAWALVRRIPRQPWCGTEVVLGRDQRRR